MLARLGLENSAGGQGAMGTELPEQVTAEPNDAG